MKRVLTGVAAMAMVAGGLSFFGVTSAGAATYAPIITISPNTDLTNGETVYVTGSGFQPNEASLIAVECVATATSATGCDTTSFAPVSINSSGDMTTLTFVVSTGTIGSGTCGTSAADATCAISVGSSATGKVAAFQTIGFNTGPNVAVTPQTGVIDGSTVSVTGTGYTGGSTVYAVECVLYATSEAGCDTGTATPITVSSTGALPATSFKVVAGTVGNGSCGTSDTNYDGCIIEVANLAETQVGFTTFDFVPEAAAAIVPKATRVSGEAMPGKTTTVTIIGSHFNSVAKITGGPGSTVTVTGVGTSAIRAAIREPANARAGTYVLIIHFKSGDTARVDYTVA